MMIGRLTRLILSTVLLILNSLGLVAQKVVVSGEPEPPAPEECNGVQLNLHAPIPYQALSLEYEYAAALDVDVGVAANAYSGKGRLNVLFFPMVGVMPYGRWYSGDLLFSTKKPNTGFLLKADSSIAYNDNLRNVYYEYSPETEKREKQIKERYGASQGISLGGGFRLVTRSNWSGEISCRLGRNMMKVSKWNVAYIYPAISVGYRFQRVSSSG